MNLQTIANLTTIAKHLGVDLVSLLPLAQFKDMRLADLTPAVVGDVAKVLGLDVDVTADTTARVVELLRGENVDAMADLLNKPESVQKLHNFLRGEHVDWNIMFCPHCRNAITP